MGMEHRWGTRQPVELDAVIDSRHRKRVRGAIRNVSSSGAFVAAPVDGLPLNSLVELIFTLHDRGVAQVHRVKVMVTRIARDGVGLMFGELRPHAISLLLASLRDHDVRFAARRISPPLRGEDDSPGEAEAGAERNAAGNGRGRI